MILVKRHPEATSQKVVGMFIKRVKKSNMIARARKTQNHNKPISSLKQKRKAVRKAQYLERQEIMERTGKKLI